MPISEKLKTAKFSKGVAGYSAKEVDGFISDLLRQTLEEEQLHGITRAKLSAFEARTEELSNREKEAYKLLEAAKKEAEVIVATAVAEAKEITRKAETEAEAKLRSAEISANAKLSEAGVMSEKIIVAADTKGKEMLREAKAFCDEQRRLAEGLAAECKNFEEKFSALVSSTASSLEAMKQNSPKASDKMHIEVAEEPKAAVIKEESVPARKAEPKPAQRKLYDSLTVTYEGEDDFDDVRKIMESGKEKKNPVDFLG